MNKKIDFYNKDNKVSNIQNNNMKKNSKQNSGSKTNKPNKINKQISIPKRRGRRPKKIIENLGGNILDESHDLVNAKNDSAVILRLNIDPSKIATINNNTKSENSSDTSAIDDTSSEGMFNNDIPRDNVCHSCVKKDKMLQFYKFKLDKHEKKDKQDNSNKMFFNKINFISIKDGKKINLKKTNIKCWWDRHEFDNLPFFLPELYHNNCYYVLGIFCSPNCALAHNLHYIKDFKMYERKSLIFRMYREMHGLSADDLIDIKEAGPWELLESFGGNMSITTFRNGFNKINREYLVYVPPIKPITISIEERNTDNNIDDFDKEYVLKRKKPLAKKRSVISSLTNKLESD
ncbi:A1L transcription factor [Acanthamoeba polyphaga moumouvirus]|uniref:A1L transcription factor n=2 Tax=Moumouvirus moumou TaxID=1128137 RepID=L7RCE0_9VIRU|nr:A1L transcription factor [Acanthamoeba polyphaga moumouvirus]AEY99278.1 viral transcription factor 2 [Moumouvirus moumou]AGC01901.1 A1L transcription factor [Acanthamoeba polyphaga moumouvirus]